MMVFPGSGGPDLGYSLLFSFSWQGYLRSKYPDHVVAKEKQQLKILITVQSYVIKLCLY